MRGTFPFFQCADEHGLWFLRFVFSRRFAEWIVADPFAVHEVEFFEADRAAVMEHLLLPGEAMRAMFLLSFPLVVEVMGVVHGF